MEEGAHENHNTALTAAPAYHKSEETRLRIALQDDRNNHQCKTGAKCSKYGLSVIASQQPPFKS